MGITTKFNLVLITVLSLSLVIIGYFSYQVLQKNARSEVVQHAGMMLESALAIRSYTVSEIRPLLKEQMTDTFLPQSVPAYAATTSFNQLRKNHPAYAYKEATLNPTNLKNRAVEWESDIIRTFQSNGHQSEITGIRDTPTGMSLFLARPIRIKNSGCLSCHGTASAAPQTLLARYGSANGFGWSMNEVVGAQIISVPMAVPIRKANEAFVTFMASIIAVYIFIVIILNVMLRHLFLKPIVEMSKLADEISMGKMLEKEFAENGKDEISVLAASFNRMRRSLIKAIAIIENGITTGQP